MHEPEFFKEEIASNIPVIVWNTLNINILILIILWYKNYY